MLTEKSTIRTRDELAMTIDEAEWQWLKPHCEKGILITVARDLDLAEAGLRIAADDTPIVAEWIRSGRVGKPTVAEIAAWDNVPTRRFPMLIISPYILMSKIEGRLFNQ
jgi:hypothetical protein